MSDTYTKNIVQYDLELMEKCFGNGLLNELENSFPYESSVWSVIKYKPITTFELKKFITENSALPKNAFLLSFDDGLKEVFTTIAPILLKKGVPASFFINPCFIDNNELFYRYKISLLIFILSICLHIRKPML